MRLVISDKSGKWNVKLVLLVLIIMSLFVIVVFAGDDLSSDVTTTRYDCTFLFTDDVPDVNSSECKSTDVVDNETEKGDYLSPLVELNAGLFGGYAVHYLKNPALAVNDAVYDVGGQIKMYQFNLSNSIKNYKMQEEFSWNETINYAVITNCTYKQVITTNTSWVVDKCVSKNESYVISHSEWRDVNDVRVKAGEQKKVRFVYKWDKSAFEKPVKVDYVPEVAGYQYPEYAWFNASCGKRRNISMTDIDGTQTIRLVINNSIVNMSYNYNESNFTFASENDDSLNFLFTYVSSPGSDDGEFEFFVNISNNKSIWLYYDCNFVGRQDVNVYGNDTKVMLGYWNFDDGVQGWTVTRNTCPLVNSSLSPPTGGRSGPQGISCNGDGFVRSPRLYGISGLEDDFVNLELLYDHHGGNNKYGICQSVACSHDGTYAYHAGVLTSYYHQYYTSGSFKTWVSEALATDVFHRFYIFTNLSSGIPGIYYLNGTHKVTKNSSILHNVGGPNHVAVFDNTGGGGPYNYVDDIKIWVQNNATVPVFGDEEEGGGPALGFYITQNQPADNTIFYGNTPISHNVTIIGSFEVYNATLHINGVPSVTASDILNNSIYQLNVTIYPANLVSYNWSVNASAGTSVNSTANQTYFVYNHSIVISQDEPPTASVFYGVWERTHNVTVVGSFEIYNVSLHVNGTVVLTASDVLNNSKYSLNYTTGNGGYNWSVVAYAGSGADYYDNSTGNNSYVVHNYSITSALESPLNNTRYFFQLTSFNLTVNGSFDRYNVSLHVNGTSLASVNDVLNNSLYQLNVTLYHGWYNISVNANAASGINFVMNTSGDYSIEINERPSLTTPTIINKEDGSGSIFKYSNATTSTIYEDVDGDGGNLTFTWVVQSFNTGTSTTIVHNYDVANGANVHDNLTTTWSRFDNISVVVNASDYYGLTSPVMNSTKVMVQNSNISYAQYAPVEDMHVKYNLTFIYNITDFVDFDNATCYLYTNGTLNNTMRANHSTTFTNMSSFLALASSTTKSTWAMQINCTEILPDGFVPSNATGGVFNITYEPDRRANISLMNGINNTWFISKVNVTFNISVSDDEGTNVTCKLYLNDTLNNTIVANSSTGYWGRNNTIQVFTVGDAVFAARIDCSDQSYDYPNISLFNYVVDFTPPTAGNYDYTKPNGDGKIPIILNITGWDNNGVQRAVAEIVRPGNIWVNYTLNRTTLNLTICSGSCVVGAGMAPWNRTINWSLFYGWNEAGNYAARWYVFDEVDNLYEPNVTINWTITGSSGGGGGGGGGSSTLPNISNATSNITVVEQPSLIPTLTKPFFSIPIQPMKEVYLDQLPGLYVMDENGMYVAVNGLAVAAYGIMLWALIRLAFGGFRPKKTYVVTRDNG